MSTLSEFPLEVESSSLTHRMLHSGLGLLEYLNWCEDLDMEPIMAVWAGTKWISYYLE